MRRAFLGIAAAAVVLGMGTTLTRAQTLMYSFEAPPVNPDGFGPNGGGIAVAQSTTGATHLSNSLNVSVVSGATFVGALTGVIPPALGDPPGVSHILFDVTLTEAFAGSFALTGVTIFGASQPDYPGGQQFGLQAQFADFEALGGKAPGTYTDVRIDLASATHPLTFAAGQSFDQIFGTVGSGTNDVIPTGFQFFFNKSNNAPLSVYLDNVRVVPEPASCAGLGVLLAGAALGRRRTTRG